MDWMVNYIWLAWKLTSMLRIDRIYNSTIRFSKFEFNNKLLSGVTLLRIASDVTWTQLYIYMLNAYIFFI